jgi:hypothetical protein
MRHAPHTTHDADPVNDRFADQLDDLLPPGRRDLPAHHLADSSLEAARLLAGAARPVLDAERVAQIEAQVLARAAMRTRLRRRRIARRVRWAVAACVVMAAAVLLAIGVALLDTGGDPHIVAPDTAQNSAQNSGQDAVTESPDSTADGAPVIIRESRESSVFVVPLNP